MTWNCWKYINSTKKEGNAKMNDNSIIVKGIKKEFGEKTILNEINFTIQKGEIFGLLGPSGVGKTTLIKILTGQIKATDGYASVLGKNVKDYKQDIYTNFGMVLDNTGLYERLSCYDNLAFYASLYQLPKQKIIEALEDVGLDKEKKKPVHKLSKGMKQRLVIARALMHEPAILFLDEPTTGLDPYTAGIIHNLIKEEQAKGKTILLTTHNMEEASKLCNNVALLCDGDIVEYGEPEEICRKYNYLNKIRLFTKSEKTVILENSSKSANKIAEYFTREDVESIHSTEPTLETVFKELTGRNLAE